MSFLQPVFFGCFVWIERTLSPLGNPAEMGVGNGVPHLRSCVGWGFETGFLRFRSTYVSCMDTEYVKETPPPKQPYKVQATCIFGNWFFLVRTSTCHCWCDATWIFFLLGFQAQQLTVPIDWSVCSITSAASERFCQQKSLFCLTTRRLTAHRSNWIGAWRKWCFSYPLFFDSDTIFPPPKATKTPKTSQITPNIV